MRMDREEAPDPDAAGAKSRGVQKLLRAAFRRGDASAARVTAWGGGGGGDGSESARSGSSSGSGSGSSSGAAARRHRRASHDGDRSSSSERYYSGELDGSNGSKLLLALRNAKIQYANEPYPWERKMRDLLLPLPGSSGFLSVLLLPKASDASATRYNSLEDTLARADTWLAASQASGVPIVFMNVQTEALLTKISGETASSTVNMGSPADLANTANASLYGFEDYHGVDIGVVRAVRLWYAPVAGETELEITLQQGDARLGFAISRTDEGFIYVSSVAEEAAEEGSAAARSGLRELFRRARGASKLLVVSRVGGEKVLPWMVSTCGGVRCFDTVSLSHKLSLHRHALLPIRLHFLLWAPPSPSPAPAPEETEEEAPEESGLGLGLGLERDSVGDASFRFQNTSLPDSWV